MSYKYGEIYTWVNFLIIIHSMEGGYMMYYLRFLKEKKCIWITRWYTKASLTVNSSASHWNGKTFIQMCGVLLSLMGKAMWQGRRVMFIPSLTQSFVLESIYLFWSFLSHSSFQDLVASYDHFFHVLCLYQCCEVGKTERAWVSQGHSMIFRAEWGYESGFLRPNLILIFS